MLIDPTVITARLRVVLEQIFQASNQAVYIGLIHRSAEPLTSLMGNRLHYCIDNLAQTIIDLEPRKIDTGCLTLEDSMILAGYAEIKQGLLRSWQFIESREQAIISRQ